MLRRVAVLTKKRKGYLQQRWREMAKPNGTGSGYRTVKDGLRYWREYFGYVRESPFLTGQAPTTNGHSKPFSADFEWLLNPNNFAKVIEGKYEDRPRATQ